ncbi:MAG: type IX secretion system membrane protein PorP/SprF [Lewinellaceae bacterium]|nr:type IX secretion system membrane protein PorP/SprF [Lewinella sp.]MCB9277305.1 type IX secretion system membrane protein PorP/SprF [Lewinellaceae bacterium]
MKVALRIFIWNALFFSVAGLQAQDPVFSQFFASPLQTNPAFTGVTFAPRITLNYRNQYTNWLGGSAYKTYAASYEQSIESLNSGLGLTLMADDAGQGIYKTNQVSAFYSYRVRTNNDIFFQFGMEAGFTQSTLDWDQLIFGDQLDPLNGPTDPSGNPYLSEENRPESLNQTRFDVSAGLLVYTGSVYGGISLKHLNTPDESLIGLNESINAGRPMRITLHGGGDFPIGRRNKRGEPSFISPNLLFIKQGDFGQINGGAYAGLGRVFTGLWYRHTFSNPDAVILLAGFREGVLRIGYSYDLTISRLATAPGGAGGTHEISLTIDFSDSKVLKSRRKSARITDCFKMFK